MGDLGVGGRWDYVEAVEGEGRDIREGEGWCWGEVRLGWGYVVEGKFWSGEMWWRGMARGGEPW